MNENLWIFILECAERYFAEDLKPYENRNLRNNWWEAFDFFLGRACYQGRRDSVSEEVNKRVRQVLIPFFENSNRDKEYETLRQEEWKPLENQLREKIGKGKIGKARDIEMILSALYRIDSYPCRNIVNYSIQKIENGLVLEHYRELQDKQSANGIVQVGPKIASFYLRDIVSLFKLGNSVDSDSAFCLQPIDVWVRRIAKKLQIVNNEADDRTIQEAIVKKCEESNVSSFRFNQGVWYAGSYSLHLLLEFASKHSLRG